MSPDLAELIEDFLDYLTAVRGYSPATATTYATALHQMEQHSSFWEEGGQWTLDIMPYRLAIRSLSKRSIHAKLTAIRSFTRYLNDQAKIPTRTLGTETIKTPQTLPKPIEENTIAEVMDAATPQERLLIAMLYGLGLRISELSALRLEQIDAEWIRILGKGNKVRQLPLLPYLRDLIQSHRSIEAPQKYLFEKEERPMSAAQLRYRLSKLFRAHGFKATPHQLRHSFATHLLAHGARIADVSELLGHASMATTQVYTKLGSVKKMEEYMGAHPLAGVGHRPN
jgi:integrase/recombinase XerC